MITSKKCPTCGATLFVDVAIGHCVRCLVKLALVHDEPLPVSSGDTLQFEQPGDRVGRYKLLQQIGEGGCGVVYMAEQEEPVRRYVALKVIKLGLDTKTIIARFEAEQQAMALMNHPNIARVLDTGATSSGRPFFVMELVRGVKITDYCDQKKLSTSGRLSLFVQVCNAIQHAHQKGVIHRDIKPSNILVTLDDGVPVPKVIDFGIAKATQQHLTDKTLFTAFEQFIGTPAYMSPEQAEMGSLDIDTRSDIYSLGVLLYELLTGGTPFDGKDLMASGVDGMRKTVREQEPVRPSTRFATLKGEESTITAKLRSTDSSVLMHELKGDLDWIVMKCLEKDRTRRYETANGIAADIKRHLNNEPIVARQPSSAYRFRKLVRRNRLTFAAGVAIAAALLLGIIFSTSQAIRATHATHEALAARQQAEAEELAARQRAYASDMNVAVQALAGNNLGRALELLNRQRPKPGQRDLRGWEWRYLWQQTRSDALFTLCQQPSEVVSLAASPDGHWLAIGTCHKGGVSMWDLQTRQELVRLAENEEYSRAAFSPTQPLLAFASSTSSSPGPDRNTLRLWNTATRQTVAERPLKAMCNGLAFAKDGRTLVTSTSSGTEGQLTLWRMPEGTKLASYPSRQDRNPGVGTCFAATTDLSLAAYGSGPKVCVIDLRNGKEVWEAVASKEAIIALAFSPDGKTLACAAGFIGASDIRLWDAAKGKETGRLEGHSYYVTSLVFWPDGKKLASSSTDQTIRIWDVASQKCLDVLRGHRQEVWRLALLADNKTLLSGGKDGTVCFWDTSVTHPRHTSITIPENVINWSFAPDGQSVLTLNQQGQVAQWTGADFQQKAPLLEMGTNVYASLFSPGGRYLTVSWTNGYLQVWDMLRQAPSHQLTNSAGAMVPLLFLAKGNRLATYSEKDDLLHEWDLTSGSEVQSWQAPALSWQEPPLFESALALTPDEKSSLAIGNDGDVVFRSLTHAHQTKVDLDVLEGNNASFSPDGKLFAVSSYLGYARVWETAKWREVATLRGYVLAVESVAFSKDGKRLATAGANGALKLWDTESWQEVLSLEGPGSGVLTAFSRDDNAIGTINDISPSCEILNLWRAPSWVEIAAAEAK
jgi:WD40 repeat protein/serine/threonine protein kinase